MSAELIMCIVTIYRIRGVVSFDLSKKDAAFRHGFGVILVTLLESDVDCKDIPPYKFDITAVHRQFLTID